MHHAHDIAEEEELFHIFECFSLQVIVITFRIALERSILDSSGAAEYA